jgi:hypothetical protein
MGRGGNSTGNEGAPSRTQANAERIPRAFRNPATGLTPPDPERMAEAMRSAQHNPHSGYAGAKNVGRWTDIDIEPLRDGTFTVRVTGSGRGAITRHARSVEELRERLGELRRGGAELTEASAEKWVAISGERVLTS